MRSVESHLLEDKMDEAVTHYINSHHSQQQVELEEGAVLGAGEEGRLAVLQPYTQPCRGGGGGAWGEELLEGGLAALVAQLQGARPRGPPLPPLHDLRRADPAWFHRHRKESGAPAPDCEPEPPEPPEPLEPLAGAAKQSKKSLPHKKRISRKLRRHEGGAAPPLLVLEVAQEQILPDAFAPHAPAPHELRPLFICTECGQYYGEEQHKFYQHLRQHYEPLALEAAELGGGCLALPDAIVELSLEGQEKPSYPPPDKHALFAPPDRAYHAAKTEECGEFSEPEDLMAGIHVCVEAAAYDAHAATLPHLTVDAGHVTQEHRDTHWLGRGGGAPGPEEAAPGAEHYCGSCDRDPPAPLDNLKEEVLQRIFESAVPDTSPFPDAILSERHLQHEHEHAAVHEHGREHALQHEQSHEQSREHAPRHEHEPQHEHAPRPERADREPAPPAPAPHTAPSDTKRQWTCATCGRVFEHRNSLLYHALSHGTRRHVCTHCEKAFYTLTALKVHSRVHSGARPYKCALCDKHFRQWSDLNYHNTSLHSDKKQFKCEYCGKQFARKYSLSVHVRIHTGERNYKCHYCTKSFRASSYRLAHMRTHTGDRPYKCSQCDKPFRSAFDLRRHALVHDKLRPPRPRRAPAPSPPAPAPAPAPAPGEPRGTKRVAVASTSRGQGAPPPRARRRPAPEQGAPAEAAPSAGNESGFIERLTALYNIPPV